MYSKKNILNLVVILITIIIFAVCFAISNFENNINTFSQNAIERFNAKNSLQLKNHIKADVSLYPWLGIRLKDIDLVNKKNITHIGEMNIKLSLIPLMHGKLSISAVGIKDVDTDAKTAKEAIISFINSNKKNKSKKIDIEMKNINIKGKIKKNNITLENIEAHIIGFDTSKPFTLNLNSYLILRGTRSNINFKTLINIDDNNISLRNNHIKFVRELENGSIWLNFDNNILIDNQNNEIFINDINGFFHNAQIIGRLKYNIADNVWNGKLNMLQNSLNNMIHNIDKKAELIDMTEAHNISSAVSINNNNMSMKLNINDTNIEANIHMKENDKLFIKSYIDSLFLDYDQINIINKIQPMFFKTIHLETNIDAIKFDNLKSYKNKLIANITSKELQLKLSSEDLYKGKALFDLIKNNNQVKLNATGKNIQASPLANDLEKFSHKISGNLYFNAEFKSNSLDSSIDDIVGEADITLKNGHLLSHLNPAALFVKTLNNNNKDITILRPSSFKYISTNCHIKNGLIKCGEMNIATYNASLQGDLNIDTSSGDIYGYTFIKQIESNDSMPMRINFYGDIQKVDSYVDFSFQSGNVADIIKRGLNE